MSKPATTQRNKIRARILLVVWVVTIAASGALYFGLPQFSTVQGIAEVVEFKVAARDDSGIQAIPVKAGDHVKAGEVVALLDTAMVEREMDLVRAEMEEQLAGLDAERRDDDRRFEEAVDDAEADLMKARVEYQKNRASLDGARARIRYWKPLVQSGSARGDTLEEIQADEVVFAGQDAALKKLVAAGEARLAQARRRLASHRGPGNGDRAASDSAEESAAQSAAVAVSRARLAELRRQLDVLTLKAPSEGLVHKVLMRPGDVARKGETIVMLRSVRPERVFAYVSDSQASLIGPGAPAVMYAQDGTLRKFRGHVLSIGGMEPWPEQMHQGLRGLPWGQQVVIAVDEETRLVPGQVLNVEFPHQKSPIEPSVPAAAAREGPTRASAPDRPADEGTPAPVSVPPALGASTRIEPSGAVWVPEIERFLIVSDDTGLADSNDHAPWLLAMGANGHLDETPVPLRGLDEVNDLESVARGPDGTFWLLSSQDVSRKGRRNVARTRLIRARIEGRALVVSGTASLAAAIAGAGDDAWRAGLGLSERDERQQKRGPGGFDRILNIEGMAAVGDSLLLGLKLPLGKGGDAIVWRLARPERLIETGTLDAADLAVHARVRLRVGTNADVPAGISDLAAMPDGRIVLLGLGLVEGGNPDRIGGLWIVQSPDPGVWSASRVREFPGLQAEGVAVGPGGRLAVVFDRKEATPLWLELPVPP